MILSIPGSPLALSVTFRYSDTMSLMSCHFSVATKREDTALSRQPKIQHREAAEEEEGKDTSRRLFTKCFSFISVSDKADGVIL